MPGNDVNGQSITIVNRESVEISNVTCVVTFDEEYVKIKTDMGVIVIDGRDLRIESLSKENGKILVRGEFIGLHYESSKKNKGKGVFG